MHGVTSEKVVAAIEKYKPDYVYACGDMTDPNSAHRLCFTSILSAFKKLQGKEKPELWMYRIDSADYLPYETDMIVPLTEAEMTKKIAGVMHHQSQSYKLQANSKQLWQKVDERSKALIDVMKRYGITGHLSFESFKLHNF